MKKKISDLVDFENYDEKVKVDDKKDVLLNTGNSSFNTYFNEEINGLDNNSNDIYTENEFYNNIQNNPELKEMFDPKNNSITQKYVLFGMDLKRATNLSFMFTLMVIYYFHNII